MAVVSPARIPSAWPVRALLHRAVGALQLLLDDGDPLALHERGAALRRGRTSAASTARTTPASTSCRCRRRAPRRSLARLQPRDHRRRRADDARPPRARRRGAAVLLFRPRAARLRQRAAQAERLDARRQPLSRSAGSCATRASTSSTWASTSAPSCRRSRSRGCARTTAGASRSCRRPSRCSSR